MDICFSSDLNYAPHLAAAIASIFKHAKPNQAITIHILHSSGLDKECQAKICELAKLHSAAEFNFIAIDSDIANKFIIPDNTHLTKEAYFRILLSSLLPKLDKVLYLDCDIIVQADLTELYCTDISNHCIAAVPDSQGAEQRKRLSLNAENRYYCNSGVMLINLARFREMDIERKLYNFSIELIEPLTLCDQDVINIILEDETTYLHSRWNMQYLNEKYPYRDLSPEHEDAFTQPCIIHYVMIKPWAMNCFHPYQNRYFEALRLTAWRQQAWKYFPLNQPIRKALKHLSSILFNRELYRKFRAIIDKI